jgi:hypothetical protein
MSRAGTDDYGVGLFPQKTAEGKRGFERGRRVVDFSMGYNAHKCTKDDLRNAERLRLLDDTLKPTTKAAMISGFFAM